MDSDRERVKKAFEKKFKTGIRGKWVLHSICYDPRQLDIPPILKGHSLTEPDAEISGIQMKFDQKNRSVYVVNRGGPVAFRVGTDRVSEEKFREIMKSLSGIFKFKRLVGYAHADCGRVAESELGKEIMDRIEEDYGSIQSLMNNMGTEEFFRIHFRPREFEIQKNCIIELGDFLNIPEFEVREIHVNKLEFMFRKL